MIKNKIKKTDKNKMSDELMQKFENNLRDIKELQGIVEVLQSRSSGMRQCTDKFNLPVELIYRLSHYTSYVTMQSLICHSQRESRRVHLRSQTERPVNSEDAARWPHHTQYCWIDDSARAGSHAKR